jgi:hypothetical protein
MTGEGSGSFSRGAKYSDIAPFEAHPLDGDVPDRLLVSLQRHDRARGLK